MQGVLNAWDISSPAIHGNHTRFVAGSALLGIVVWGLYNMLARVMGRRTA